jgi:hypothetical protein
MMMMRLLLLMMMMTTEKPAAVGFKTGSPLLCLQLQTGCSNRRPIGRPGPQKVVRTSAPAR